MKVLWLSNIDLCDSNPSASGTWIYSMYNALKKYTKIEVCANITFTENKKPFNMIEGNRNNYYIPNIYVKKDGRPKNDAIKYIQNIISIEKPDLIHIWGTEKGWGLMINDKMKQTIPCLLEIQGLVFFVAEECFYGGINDKEIRKMRGLIEYIYPNNRIERIKKRFQQWGETEKKIIQSYDYVNTQSEWVRDLIYWVAPKVRMLNTDIILRDSFINAPLWSIKHQKGSFPILLTTTSASLYKGLHITLRSFVLVKKYFPLAQLHIAGIGLHKSSWKDTGYIQYLRKICVELGIEDNVMFLGRLDEKKLLSEMYNADVFVISTFVESYCLALAEALCLGMPCVAPFTSAISELIVMGKNGDLYPMGDYYVCARKIVELIKDNDRSVIMGNMAALIQRKKSDPCELAIRQAKTYRRIYDDVHNKNSRI